MKKKNISLLLVTLLVMLSSCSEFYSDEQYEHYVSSTTYASRVSTTSGLLVSSGKTFKAVVP